MRNFDYSASPVKLLITEIVHMVDNIHEHKGKQELFLEANIDYYNNERIRAKTKWMPRSIQVSIHAQSLKLKFNVSKALGTHQSSDSTSKVSTESRAYILSLTKL